MRVGGGGGGGGGRGLWGTDADVKQRFGWVAVGFLQMKNFWVSPKPDYQHQNQDLQLHSKTCPAVWS